MTTREPVSRWAEPADEVGEEYRLRRAAEDAALEPWALLKAVRDSGGRVVDFVYHDINSVAARQQRLRREDLLGRSVAESLPELVRSGILAKYVHCIDTGEPLVLDDLSYYGRTLDGPELQTHLYEMRGVRVETEYLSLNWRDVNARLVTQQRVAESEERYRLLAENSSDVVAHLRNLAVVWVSPSVEDSLGAPPQQWIGQQAVSLVVAEDLPVLAELVEQTSAGDTVARRLRLRGLDGVVHWVEVHAKLFYDAQGNPDGHTASARVIDAQVAAEQALEDARRVQAGADALYREVVGSAAVGTCITSPEGTFLDVNDAMCEFFGYDATTLCAKSWQEVTAPEYLAHDLAKVEDILAGRLDRYRTIKQFINAGGHRLWGDLSVGCLRGPGGAVQKFIAQVVDVTAEVTAQDELVRYKQLIETSSVGTALSNLDGSMAVVNQAMCDLAGFDMDTALQMTWMQAIPEPHLQALLGAIDDLLAGRIDSYRGEHVFIHADGQPRWIDVSLSVMRKPDGQPEYVIFQSVDITAEVQAREQLEAARLLLAASADSMLDPQVLLEAVRDRAGQVIDFAYRTVNAATCSYLGLQESDLVGHTQLEASPNLEGSELQRRYIRCLEDGEPVILDDYPFFNEIIDDDRRYDIRATRAGADLISLTWRDVTDRFKAAQRALEAQTLLHASVDSMLNPQMLLEAVRDRAGRVVDFVYRSANLAFCSYRGWEEREIIGQSLVEAQPSLLSSGLFGRYITCVDTGESVILDDFEMFNAMLGDDRRFDIRVVRAGVDLISLTFSDVTERSDAAERIASSERAYRLLAENSSDMVTHVRDGRFVWTSPSVADVVGASPEYWVGRPVSEIIPPEGAAALAARLATLAAGGTVRERIRVVAVDGVTHWVDLHARPLYGDDGHQDGATAALRLVDAEVAAQQEAEEARRQQARADALYRRSVDSAAVGMCLINAEGGFVDVNEAVCEFFGYDAETLKSKTWQELTAEAYMQADLDKVADVLAGRIESYRMTKEYIHAEGHPIWGDLSVGCVRDGEGHVEVFVSQINDITAEVQARERLVISEERNRVLAEGLQAELSSAAKYLQSVLPADVTGQVSVSTRYLPSNTLGGDCFDFRWIDDDHMIVYQLDVSGHGVESALIAVSVHNLLRSASFTTETMLEPDRVLAALNQQFGMDQHDDNYFTAFYGVYQRSSATLRYANAGHPPALLFTAGQVTELSSQSMPVGMFGDTPFATATVPIPPGSQMLLYSDGVYELPRDNDGQWPLRAFVAMCTRLGGSPDWTLDDVIENALANSATGSFDDDCCLVRLKFD